MRPRFGRGCTMGFFNFGRKKGDRGYGFSPDTPIVLGGVPSHKAGIAKEYQILVEMFGVQGQDWDLAIQALMHHGDRSLDVMDVTLADGTRERVYFDVTALFSLPRQSEDENAREERYSRARQNMESLLAALSRDGDDAFDAEFDRLFPPGRSDDADEIP